jgi:hypothetical protein
MLTALVCTWLRRPVEATGVTMGDFEIIDIKTGKRLRIDKDGSELRDEVTPPAIEWCDKGQHYASKLGGRDDQDTLWICLACQK